MKKDAHIRMARVIGGLNGFFLPLRVDLGFDTMIDIECGFHGIVFPDVGTNEYIETKKFIEKYLHINAIVTIQSFKNRKSDPHFEAEFYTYPQKVSINEFLIATRFAKRTMEARSSM